MTAVAFGDLRRPMALGEILGGALTLYRRNFAVFLGIAAVVLPINLVITILFLWIATPDPIVSPLVTLAVTAASIIIDLIAASAIARAIADGLPADFNRAYRQVLDRAGTFILAAARVVGITLLLAITIIGIPFAVYLGIRWSFFPQAVVIEGRDSRDALSLSVDIVKGSWWRTFGILATVLIVGWVVSSPATAISWTISRPAGAVLGVLVGVVVRPFTAAAWTLLFFDLSSRESQDASIA